MGKLGFLERCAPHNIVLLVMLRGTGVRLIVYSLVPNGRGVGIVPPQGGGEGWINHIISGGLGEIGINERVEKLPYI